MTSAESKALKEGARVYWRGDAKDAGSVIGKTWDAVTISWDDGKVATVQNGDMREISAAPKVRLLGE
jgi:hypothetical protein